MNSLEIIFRGKVVIAQPDKRYRVLVDLKRVDRPRYWIFLCNNCGAKVVDIQNLEVFGDSDFFDSQNINNTGIGRHCKGTMPNGLPCPYSYFFSVH